MNQFIYPLDPFHPDLPLNVFGIGYEDNQPHTIRKSGFPSHNFSYAFPEREP